MWRILVALSAACLACRSPDRVIDRRAAALEGDWRVVLHTDAGTSTGRIALVAVRGDVRALGEAGRPLAAGAITMEQGSLERRVADGTRVDVAEAPGDSVAIRVASRRSEPEMILTGMLRGDSIVGAWRGAITRTSELRGRFVVTRAR